jgi:hypothetical protein
MKKDIEREKMKERKRKQRGGERMKVRESRKLKIDVMKDRKKAKDRGNEREEESER